MAGVVRLGDISAGHAHCYPPRANTAASGNVFCNGKGVHRLGDGWGVHGACKDHVPHSGQAAGGSPNVLANNKAVCRIGDVISCGDSMAQGSSNVIANG